MRTGFESHREALTENRTHDGILYIYIITFQSTQRKAMQRLQSYGISLVFDAVIDHFNLRGGTGQHML